MTFREILSSSAILLGSSSMATQADNFDGLNFWYDALTTRHEDVQLYICILRGKKQTNKDTSSSKSYSGVETKKKVIYSIFTDIYAARFIPPRGL